MLTWLDREHDGLPELDEENAVYEEPRSMDCLSEENEVAKLIRFSS